MPQTDEATAFLGRVAQLSAGAVDLDGVLKPSLDDEAELRKMFAQDKTNVRLKDCHVGLVDVFDAPAAIRTTRARVIANEKDLDAQCIMPLSQVERRAEGSPAMVPVIDEFRKNWSVFTEGSLSQLDWSNVVAAGGSVQACLLPLPENAKVSKRATRKHYHSAKYPASDVDLFLYGLTPEQAEAKIITIYEAVRDSIPWDVTCIRTKHTVSIHSQYPYRAVQIVLRLYQSPAEILAGFDVDAPCCAYDGDRVWANPRAIVAMMRQCNTVDITRRSPSYEVRLTKYAARGFEIYVPQLKRDDIDPTIFERSIVRVQGLARLLALEKLSDASMRESYVAARRNIRGRPTRHDGGIASRRSGNHYSGDLKDGANAGIQLSDYDILSLHIPYGPRWDARRIEKLIYQTDLGMNSPFNPKNKGRRLHRHPAFFGTMPECLEDCCEHCVVAKDDEERAKQEQEDKSYVRGRVQFIIEDPGRQSMSGSFNPIDEGEWTEQAYMGPTERFFNSIASHDRPAVAALIANGIDVNRRDHVGRTPLQVAVMSKAVDIACDLVDANARMTVRTVDGRTALHFAAQLDLPTVVKKLLERSAVNREAVEAAEREVERAKDDSVQEPPEKEMDTEEEDADDNDDDSEMRDSSADDWSSEDDRPVKQKTEGAKPDDGNIPDEEEEEPDVFEIDVLDWDYALSPLHYAIIAGSPLTLDLLLSYGADATLVAKIPQYFGHKRAHPLILTAVTEDEDIACRIVEKLLAAGAFSAEADENLSTIFHRMVCLSKVKIVATFLRCDPKAKAVLDVPYMANYRPVIYPVVSAIRLGSYSVLAVLLAHGIKLAPGKDDFEKARDLKMRYNQMPHSDLDFPEKVPTPLEVALANHDEVIHLLVALGVDVNGPVRDTVLRSRITYLEYARLVLAKIAAYKAFWLAPADSVEDNTIARDATTFSPTWKAELEKIVATCNTINAKQTAAGNTQAKMFLDEIKNYFNDAVKLLTESGGKSGEELYNLTDAEVPDRQKIVACYIPDVPGQFRHTVRVFGAGECKFYRHTKSTFQAIMHSSLVALYDELFAACYAGDNVKIQQLCMPRRSHKSSNTPLQISVQWGNQWRGFTPLYLAILSRKWDTAKLILSIATSQHSPDEPVEKFGLERFNFRDADSDSDNSDIDDDVEMDDEEEQPIKFIDVTKEVSEVRAQVSPDYMLNRIPAPVVNKDGQVDYVYPMVQAIMEDDFEAFMQILNISKSLPIDPFKGSLLGHLLIYDRPAMLDEYIRRTGEGIQIQAVSQSADEDDSYSPGRKEYLGLNIHGKKRKDLAMRGDPGDRRASGKETPILWTAVRAGLTATVRYLASDQPLAAYRFYASSNTDQHAKRILQVSNLADVLPTLLGWSANDANETVLTAAIVGDRFEMMEMLLTLRPNDMQSCCQLRNRVHGCNNILAAAWLGRKPAFLDLLLAQGVSPMELDNELRNIYHILCSYTDDAHYELLEHSLRHIPKDLTSVLLQQQHKRTGQTPLHIATEKGSTRFVRLLTQVDVPQYLIRDSAGSIPLHVAVNLVKPDITRLVAEAGPDEALTLEDGVGNTALETVTQHAYQDKLRTVCDFDIRAPNALQPSWNVRPFKVAQQERELASFKTTLYTLVEEGRLTMGTKLHVELSAFAERLATRIQAERALLDSIQKVDPKAQDDEASSVAGLLSPSSTLDILTSIVKARGSSRRLVHLSDVHRSVQASLDTVKVIKKPVVDDDENENEKTPVECVLTATYGSF